MNTFSTTQPTIDDLLNAASLELQRFMAELQELSERDTSRETLAEIHQAVTNRLNELHERLSSKRERAREKVSELRTYLAEFRAELPSHRLGEFRESLDERYEELLQTLREMRIKEPLDVEEANREPKLLRAIFHVGMGVACVALYQFLLTRGQALWLLGGFVSFFGLIEVVRRFSPKLNDFWVDKIFGVVARPQERYRTNSATFYLWGLLIITLFAPKTLVCAAILVLAVGDPIASAIGHRWGLHRFSTGKSLGGSLAFFVSSTVVLAVFLSLASGMSTLSWVTLALALSATGTVAELINGKIDDNFAIPVACAAVGLLWTGFVF